MHSISSSMAYAHTSSLIASSKVNGSSICENRENTEKEFVVSTLYMSCRLIVFLGNRLSNVGSRDVELLELLVGVFCSLGVDRAPTNLTGVVCAMICVAVLKVEGIAL
jgi:hypothetical protein